MRMAGHADDAPEQVALAARVVVLDDLIALPAAGRAPIITTLDSRAAFIKARTSPTECASGFSAIDVFLCE